MTKRLLQLWFLVVGAFCSSAQVDWPTLQFSLVATNLASPVHITHAGDGSGRLFVVEQQGTIRILTGTNLGATPFLDIRDRVLKSGERGLLCVAFPPGYATNSHFYVNYTRQPDGATVISRFQLINPSLADTNSEQILKVISKPFANHNGGQLAFGPDGYLYIGTGDGGYGTDGIGDPFNNAQNKLSLLGKLLRIDVENGVSSYSIPVSNPFYGNTNYAPEIWALGLRNPWRFSFDRLTGDLFIGDVGHFSYEEVDFQSTTSTGGANYGWPTLEALSPYKSGPTGGLTAPITSYDRLEGGSDGGGSVTGGFVYRGPDEPRLNGVYFFGDYTSGQIWGSKYANSNWQRFEVVHRFEPNADFRMSTFGEDESGTLYLADYRGAIYQIQDSHKVWAPVFSPTNGTINLNYAGVSCATIGAVIHYTTNGIDPTELDPIIASGGTIPVINGATNKLRAYRPDLVPSAVTTAIFTFKVGTPTFNPPPGAIASNSVLTITTVTPNALIYFTTNGATPTTSSPLYTGPITVKGGFLSLRALGVATGYVNSLIASGTYTAAQVPTPVFTPSAGPITNGTTVVMSCSNATASIYYTLDGTTPTTSSLLYSGPITINGNTTVKAKAYAANYTDSLVKSVTYGLLNVATLTFTPATGPVPYGTTVSVAYAAPGAVLYYTTDGTDPTTASAIYSGPIPIYDATTLSVRAVAPGYVDAVTSVFYSMPQVAPPKFSPSPQAITNGTLISISTTTSNATIHYTIDGSEPDTNSPVYSTPILFTNLFVLSARAYAPHTEDSDLRSGVYRLLSIEKTVVTTIAGGPSSGFSNGIGCQARFSSPNAICMDTNGNLFVADTGNAVIRKISPSLDVTTFAGTGSIGSTLGPASVAQFSNPTGVSIDATGNLYVADGGNCNRVCKIDTNGIVSVLANVAEDCSSPAMLGQLESDRAGNVYAGSWHSIEKISEIGTVVGIPMGQGELLNGIAIDAATNLYGLTSRSIWKTFPDGAPDLFAGNPELEDDPGTDQYMNDGWRLQAGLASYDGVFDANTNMFVVEPARVRKISPDGWVSTLAGYSNRGYKNGPGSRALFNYPMGICVDTNGNVYVADTGNNCIRRISVDADGDGIPDFEETAGSGFTVGVDDRNVDSDGDGCTNAEEYIAGTDSLSATSRFEIKSATCNGNAITLQWNGAVNRHYEVSYSSDLVLWTVATNMLSVSNGVTSTTLTNSPTTKSFYRLSVSFP